MKKCVKSGGKISSPFYEQLPKTIIVNCGRGLKREHLWESSLGVPTHVARSSKSYDLVHRTNASLPRILIHNPDAYVSEDISTYSKNVGSADAVSTDDVKVF